MRSWTRAPVCVSQQSTWGCAGNFSRARAEGERHGPRVARRAVHARNVDASRGDARRRARLHASEAEAERREGARKRLRRRLVPAARLAPALPHVHEAREKRPGRHDGRAARERRPVLEDDAGEPALFHREARRRSRGHRDARRRLHDAAQLGRVERLVGLAAQAAHGGAARRVQDLELDRRAVRDEAHRAAERVDLAHDLALREPADRGIAAHPPDRRGVARHEQRRGAEPRRGERGLRARVPAPDDDDVPASRSRATL